MLNKAITKHIKPILTENNFRRIKPRVFYRVRGEFIDVVLFEISRHGRLLSMYYFTNLLSYPNENEILGTYRLGKKVGYSSIDKVCWESSNALDTVKSMLSIQQYIEEKILKWFDEMDSLEKYVVEVYLLGNKEIIEFCDENMCEILAKDRDDLVANMYGMYSPCKDEEALYSLLRKTKNIEKNEVLLERIKDDNIQKNKLRR